MQTTNMASIDIEYLLINRVARCPVLNQILGNPILSGFGATCPFENFTSNRTQIYRYIHKYTDPDPQFLAPHGAWKWVESVWCFRRADLATLAIIDTAEMHRVSCASRIHLLTAVAFVAFG